MESEALSLGYPGQLDVEHIIIYRIPYAVTDNMYEFYLLHMNSSCLPVGDCYYAVVLLSQIAGSVLRT